jgi:tRNA U34 5-methylaminomethyl-2-thiouridine-forming methyltransferase MnmC
MNDLEVIATGDGSHSILNTSLQETYHSRHGAVRESTHVFIDHGFRVLEWLRPGPVRILEVGFGTGLNAALTQIEAARTGRAVIYESWEKFPLPDRVWEQLNYGAILGHPEVFNALHQAPWNEPTEVGPGFTLFKRTGDLLVDALTGIFDLIYYDAFAPSKQPEMWALDVLRKVTSTLVRGGILVTYCAKGQVKRDLAVLGLVVETLPGPPGKKEMTRAIRS